MTDELVKPFDKKISEKNEPKLRNVYAAITSHKESWRIFCILVDVTKSVDEGLFMSMLCQLHSRER